LTGKLKDEVINLSEKLATSQENVKTLKSVILPYIQMKERHSLPELCVMFDRVSNEERIRSAKIIRRVFTW